MNNMANIIMNNKDEIEFETSGRSIIYWLEGLSIYSI
jgi:hypothetical protein